MEIAELSYALDTFYFLVMGALVMWMAAGFTMLEAGLVRAKNTAEILTKNVGLYSIACIMYMLCGYGIMYGDGNGVIPGISMLTGADNAAADVIAGGDDAPYYSGLSDFFFQVVFVATAMSIVSGAVAERMKLWSFFAFAVILTGFIYPIQGYWKWAVAGWMLPDSRILPVPVSCTCVEQPLHWQASFCWALERVSTARPGKSGRYRARICRCQRLARWSFGSAGSISTAGRS